MKTIKYFIRQRSKNGTQEKVRARERDSAKEKYANGKNYAYVYEEEKEEELERKTHTVDRLKSQYQMEYTLQCQETATRAK